MRSMKKIDKIVKCVKIRDLITNHIDRECCRVCDTVNNGRIQIGNTQDFFDLYCESGQNNLDKDGRHLSFVYRNITFINIEDVNVFTK